MAESFGIRRGLMNRVSIPSIKRSSEVRLGAAPRPIADDDLLLEQQRFCGHGPHATRAEEFRYRYDQINREEEKFAHERNGTMPTVARKTARNGPYPIDFGNSPPTREIAAEDVP
jgi:hypothetical protein